MSENEYKLADTRGEYAQVRRDGDPLADAGWVESRLVLSNKRLVLAAGGDKRTIPLGRVRDVGDRYDVNDEIADGPGYVALRLEGDDVVLVAPGDPSFESALYRALLDGQVVLVRHPAGGDDRDSPWQKARLAVDAGTIELELPSGATVAIDADGVGATETDTRPVRNQERPVLDVEHDTDGAGDGTAVSGKRRHVSILESFLTGGGGEAATPPADGAEAPGRPDYEVSDAEREVLVALYSGVSPFEIPEFLDMEVDEVEPIYDRLVEHDVLEEVRKRREVTLKARGRNIASDAIGDG